MELVGRLSPPVKPLFLFCKPDGAQSLAWRVH